MNEQRDMTFALPPHDCNDHPVPTCTEHYRGSERGCEACYNDIMATLGSIPGCQDLIEKLNYNPPWAPALLTFRDWWFLPQDAEP
jgi:hypothetical protein